MMKRLLLAAMWLVLTKSGAGQTITVLDEEESREPYSPTWSSLDSRPLPSWYDEAKFGIFMHWGVYCVPGFGSEWFWANWRGHSNEIETFMKENYPPGFTYQDFGPQFRAEFFNASQWADILADSGAKYVVLTSKHHEGYAMWNSGRSFGWNSVDVGPHRDLVGELSSALRNRTAVRFGVYYSLYEWYNPLYLQDKAGGFKEQTYVDQKMLPDLKELVDRYEPEVIWTDGDWETEDKYWRSQEFLAWLYNESPVKDSVVVNDRWGSNIPCHHGGFYTCTDRYNPQTLQAHKWENCMTVDRTSWGFRRNAKLSDFKTLDELVKDLVTTVSCGGNLLMNVGPTKEGTISPIFQERLSGMGSWLRVNGEAIYKTKPWMYQNDTIDGNVWYTAKNNPGCFEGPSEVPTVYATVLKWPVKSVLTLGALAGRLREGKSVVTMLGYDTPLQWTNNARSIWIDFPNMADISGHTAWSLKITNVVTNIC